MPTFLFVCQAMCAFYYEIILFEAICTYLRTYERTYICGKYKRTYLCGTYERTYLCGTYERTYLFENLRETLPIWELIREPIYVYLCDNLPM